MSKTAALFTATYGLYFILSLLATHCHATCCPTAFIRELNATYKMKVVSLPNVFMTVRAQNPFASIESLLSGSRRRYDADYDQVLLNAGIAREVVAECRVTAWDDAICSGKEIMGKNIYPFLMVIGHPGAVKHMAAVHAWNHYLDAMLEVADSLVDCNINKNR